VPLTCKGKGSETGDQKYKIWRYARCETSKKYLVLLANEEKE